MRRSNELALVLLSLVSALSGPTGCGRLYQLLQSFRVGIGGLARSSSVESRTAFEFHSGPSTTQLSTAACQPPYGCQPVDRLTERAVSIGLRHPHFSLQIFGDVRESIIISAC